MKRPSLRNGLVLSSIIFLFSFEQLSGQVKIDTVAIDQLYAKSKTFWYTNHDSSVFYLQQVEKLSKTANYIRGNGYANYGLGWNEYVLFKRLRYFIHALDFFEQVHEKAGMAVTLTQMSTVYFSIGEVIKARDYLLKALELQKSRNDPGGVALCYILIGNSYQNSKAPAEALKNYNEALIYRLKEGTHQGIAYAQINIAEAFFELKDFEKAAEYAADAYANFLSTPDVQAQLWAKSTEGRSLFQMEREDDAKIALELVVNNKEGVKYNHHVIKAQRALASLYLKKNKLKEAVGLQAQYIIVRDTLDAHDYRIETQRMANEYEFKNAEKEAQLQQDIVSKQLARRNTMEYLTIAIVVLLFFVLLFSGRKRLGVTLINAFTFIGLLLLFEFLLVITDPFVEGWTQGEPLLKLFTNVILALLILPCHQLLERFTRRKLIKDSNQITDPDYEFKE